MLTTTVDGLWALQVLSGIEVVAPELALRPHLPSVETRPMALSHPVAGELRDAGAITASGEVDGHILEWLTVLSRRNRALLMHASPVASTPSPDTILLAGYSRWWVALERRGSFVRLSGVGTATTEQTAGQLISKQTERIWGRRSPAVFRPVTVDVGDLVSSVVDRRSLLAFLARNKVDADQAAALVQASDPTVSRQITAVAVTSATSGAARTSRIGEDAVTIIDSPAGRLSCEHVRRGGKTWMVITPGTAGQVASAVTRLILDVQRHRIQRHRIQEREAV